jgi:hypothetical protein
MLQLLALPLVFLVFGAGLIALASVTISTSNDVVGRTSSFVIDTVVGIEPDLLMLTYLSNNSDLAFCVPETFNMYWYNITNYDAVRTDAATAAVPEFHELQYNFTRNACSFGFIYSTGDVVSEGIPVLAVKGDGSFPPISPIFGFGEDDGFTIWPGGRARPDQASVVASRFYDDWEVAWTNAEDPDEPLSVLNFGYITFCSAFDFNPDTDLSDSPVAREQALYFEAFSARFSQVDDSDLDTLLADYPDAPPKDHLMWIVVGEPTGSMMNPLNQSVHALSSAGPIYAFYGALEQLDSTNETLADDAAALFNDVYQLTRPEAEAVGQIIIDFVDSDVKAYIAGLLDTDQGSGPVWTRTPLELLYLAEDPLFETLGVLVHPATVEFTDAFVPASSFMARDWPSTASAAGGTTYSAINFRHENQGAWFEGQIVDWFDNGTETATDDGQYVFIGFIADWDYDIPYPNTTQCLCKDRRHPDHWVDLDGIEYPGTLVKAASGESELWATVEWGGDASSTHLEYHGTYDYNGLELHELRVPSVIFEENLAEARPFEGLYPVGANRGISPDFFMRRGDWSNLPCCSNWTIVSDQEETAVGKTFFHGPSGIRTGLSMDYTRVMVVQEYREFPNHYLPGGFYPQFGGSYTYDFNWNTPGSEACRFNKYGFDAVKVNVCEQLSALTSAHDLSQGTLVLYIVIGALSVLFAIFLAVSQFM